MGSRLNILTLLQQFSQIPLKRFVAFQTPDSLRHRGVIHPAENCADFPQRQMALSDRVASKGRVAQKARANVVLRIVRRKRDKVSKAARGQKVASREFAQEGQVFS